MEIKSVMFDYDHVLCDGCLRYWINAYLGTNYQEEDFTSYYMQDIIPEEYREDFYKYYASQKDCYSHTNLNPGAVEVTKYLVEMGLDVFIGSSFLLPQLRDKSDMLLASKVRHILANFPHLDINKAVFTGSKERIVSDVKVDDLIANLKNTKYKLLFKAYHNKNITREELKQNNSIFCNDLFVVGDTVEKILTKNIL